MLDQRANGFRAVSLAPTPFITQTEANFGLPDAIVHIKIGDRSYRGMPFIFDDEPELPPVALHIVTREDGQKFFHRFRIGTQRVIAPDLIVALPVKHVRGILHGWTAYVHPFSMQNLARLVSLCLCHASPNSPAKLVP